MRDMKEIELSCDARVRAECGYIDLSSTPGKIEAEIHPWDQSFLDWFEDIADDGNSKSGNEYEYIGFACSIDALVKELIESHDEETIRGWECQFREASEKLRQALVAPKAD